MTYSQADITVPYAVANFAEIRHKGYYYVDKTNYIPLLERYKIVLFTSRFTQQVQQAKVLLPRVLPYQPLLLGYDHPEGQLQNGFAKLDDQECMQKHT